MATLRHQIPGGDRGAEGRRMWPRSPAACTDTAVRRESTSTAGEKASSTLKASAEPYRIGVADAVNDHGRAARNATARSSRRLGGRDRSGRA
eukprot:scaffold12213_cov115-Isochrysis_galbana.AAC.7